MERLAPDIVSPSASLNLGNLKVSQDFIGKHLCVYVWGEVFVYLLCVCGRGQCRVCHDKSGSQKTTCRVISLLPRGLIGLNAGFQI